MDIPLEWLTWLRREDSRLISVAAGTKRGDASRRIAWGRVRQAMPELAGQSIRTLQRRYETGLRDIVARLTSMSSLSYQ